MRKTQLHPISRYMKNQLNRLEIKCSFAEEGCDYVSALESIEIHEIDCKFNSIYVRKDVMTNSLALDSMPIKRKLMDKKCFKKLIILRTSLKKKQVKHVTKIIKEAVYLFGHLNYGQMAAYIKTHLVPEDNKLWHCIVGNEFDCFVTTNNDFISLVFDGMFIIAFKTK